MPRQRRTHKAHVDLASLVDRAHQQQHPYSGRPSRVQSRHKRAHVFNNRSRSHEVRSGHTSRNAVISVGTHAVWNTLVRPISILKWLPLRRSMRIRRSCRSRSRRSQRNNSEGSKSDSDVPKIGSKSRIPDAAVEIPCCANESPTAEVHMMSDNEESRQQQCSEEHTLTPPISTLILHKNPLFDGEGNTRSGLIDRSVQKAKFDKAKSRWNVRCDKTPTQQSVRNEELQDAAKKKKRTSAEKKVPAKKGSGTEDSSAASMNSPSSGDSGASSEKSKTATEESNSFEDRVDSATQAPTAVSDAAVPVSNFNATETVGRMVENSGSNGGIILLDLPQPTQQLLQIKDESVSRVSGNYDGVGRFEGSRF